MELSEDQIIEKNAKQCLHCTRNSLPPYKYEYTCIACVYNVIKRKHQLYKKTTKENKFYQ